MNKKLEQMIAERIAWLDEFLRNFSSFLSTESLNRIGIYKQALAEVLQIMKGLEEKKKEKKSKPG